MKTKLNCIEIVLWNFPSVRTTISQMQFAEEFIEYWVFLDSYRNENAVGRVVVGRAAMVDGGRGDITLLFPLGLLISSQWGGGGG